MANSHPASKVAATQGEACLRRLYSHNLAQDSEPYLDGSPLRTGPGARLLSLRLCGRPRLARLVPAALFSRAQQVPAEHVVQGEIEARYDEQRQQRAQGEAR